MLNFTKLIEVFISLQIIIVSTFIPVFFTIPFSNKLIGTYEMPITWQLPSIVIITLIFNGKIVIKAFSIYLIIGLFFIPVFDQGGSLGYLLTPNFGYLLGMDKFLISNQNLELINILMNLLRKILGQKTNQLLNRY